MTEAADLFTQREIAEQKYCSELTPHSTHKNTNLTEKREKKGKKPFLLSFSKVYGIGVLSDEIGGGSLAVLGQAEFLLS